MDVYPETESKGMKKIIRYVTDFFRHDCNYTYLALLILLVGAFTFINFYYLSEDRWIHQDLNALSRLIKYCTVYFVVFGGAYALQAVVDFSDRRLRDWKLWLLIVFAVLLFSVRTWYRPHQFFLSLMPFAYYALLYKIVINLAGLVFICIPCFVYWWFVDRGREYYYGCTAKGVTLWPYYVLILLMVPLLLWAGTQPDFQEVYPRGNHLQLGSRPPFYMVGIIVYEFCYSLDYGVTEFFFRGFLIIAFARFVGPKSILPMCAFYVAIHFDKPLGEALSSFFGGFLLGVIAYRSRSIYGGIIVHLGIALLMELVGWMHLIHPA
jgi:membrane protease YdiL (CAAX protease family)